MSTASTKKRTYPDPGESSTFEVTYEEFMAMPVTSRRIEVVDGVLIAMPAARYHHQKIAERLGRAIGDFAKDRRLGTAISGSLDVIICKKPKLRVRQPDVAYFSDEVAGFHVVDDLDRLQDEQIKPVLVIEVLSPGQNERTLAVKLADYASIEIEEVWFVDQEAKSIRVLALDGASYRPSGEFRAGERLASAVLPELALDLVAIFGG